MEETINVENAEIDEGQEFSKEFLERALSDGVISREQHDILASRMKVKHKEEERKNIQKILIAAGMTILIVVTAFAFLLEQRYMDYVTSLSILVLITVCLFFGAIFARKIDYKPLYYGLLAGGSNLFVFSYGFWFYYQRTTLYTWKSIESADRNIALAIPLIIIPVIILSYLFYKNSRWGSQGAFVSLFFGSYFTFARAMSGDYDSFRTGFKIIGILGLIVLIISIALQLEWRRGQSPQMRHWFMQRKATYRSLMSSGYILGSLYLIFLWAIFHDPYYYRHEMPWGPLLSFGLAFFVIFYGINTNNRGLILSACGIIVISTWVIGLFMDSRTGSAGTLICLGVITAIILIGLAFVIRWSSRRFPINGQNEPKKIYPVPPKKI